MEEEKTKDDICYTEVVFTWKKKVGSGYHNIVKRGWTMSYSGDLEEINRDIIAMVMTMHRFGIKETTKIKDFQLIEITKSEFLGKKNK
jgi:hypothetical protein